MKKLVLLLSLVLPLALAGCATTLQTVQSDLAKIYPQTIGKVDLDAQATLTSIQADLAAGKITPVQAQQLSACPQAVLNFTGLVRQMFSGAIPDGAGAIWLAYQAKKLQSSDLGTFNTQVKLVVNTCAAMASLPGTPF